MEKSLRICSRLEEQQHICAPVQDIPNLLEILENNIGSGIDLLICNYFVFSSATYNPYETMKELLHNVKIPFIFFNDPLLPAANKSMYWENSIRKYYPFSSSLDLTGIYRSFFMWLTINSSMEKLLNENVDNGLKNNMIVNEDELVSCAMELEIPNSRLELLRYFWKNQGKTLYSSDICKSIWNKDDDSTM
ncbi:MAG: hypothetical protein J5857_12000, partial [Treponema sp.]|nr:hypothetical protein [Treponema sp.]